MKNLLKSLMLAIASVAALSACNKEAEVVNPVENDEVIVLSFVSEKPDLNDSETRTVYNPSTGFIDWSAGDKIKVGITVDDTWMAAAGAPEEGKFAKLYLSSPLAEGGATGVFNVSTDFTVAAPGTYKFYGLYPGEAVSGNDAPNIPSVTFSIPTMQVPVAASFDPVADVMVAASAEYGGIPSDRKVNLAWTRVVAHGDITLTKLPEFASDETLQGLTISAQADADLVGTHTIDLTSGAVTLPNNATTINEIQIDTRNLTVNTTDNTLEFWFSSLPFTASSIKVVLNTNKKIYTKEYTGINLSFLANRRNTLSIGMKNATEVDKNQLIANGEYVISYDPANKMMAVGTETDDFRASVALNTDTPTDDAIWTITYDATQDAYRIYNANVAKYLFGNVGNDTYLKLCETDYDSQSYTSLFKITESTTVDGAYVITPLGNTTRKIGCNTSQPRFALYVGGTNQPVNLNIHSVSLDTTPRIEVVNSSVNMAKSAITDARTINTIKRKYYDGAITVSSSADWLVVSNLAAGETEVKATVAANTGEQRTATVTLSADGIETKTFTVVQATGASSVTDVIDRPLTGVSGTGYSNWSGKTSHSSAVYAGRTAVGNGAVQFKNGDNTGIVTTASGGNVKTIVVTWNSNTGSGRSLDIYGKSTAYDGPADLFDNSKQGTKIGSIARDATTLEVTGDYEFFGIRAVGGAVYLDQIEITWGDAKQEAPISWSAETAEATLSNSGTSFTAPTLNGASGLDITYQSTAPEVASVASDGTVTLLAAGTTDIKAVFEGNDAYKPKTVSYTLTVVDNRTFTITVNQPAQGGTISVSPSSAQKAGTVITLTADPATGYQLAEWIVTTASGSVSVNSNQFTMPAADVTVTASFSAETDIPIPETITFSEMGYSNQQDITTVDGKNMTITFNKGTNSNAPKYYTSGSAIRAYGGNYFTVAAKQNHSISKIVLTFGSSDGTNSISTDVETYRDGTWEGNASSVTFTIDGSSGHRRISAIKVTYSK